MKKKRTKYSEGGASQKVHYGDIFSLESKHTASQGFRSREYIGTAKLGSNTKVNISRYKDNTGQRSQGQSLEQVFGKNKNKSIAVSYNKPKYGEKQLTFIGTWRF